MMAESKKSANSEDASVGYGRPPRHTRFKPGQSGNPKGRPKGTKNLKTDLKEVLGEKIVVREGDRTRTVSKQRAMVIGLVNRTLKGDARAAGLLLSLITRLIDTGEGGDDVQEPLTADELEILSNFEDRVSRKNRASDTGAVGNTDEKDDSAMPHDRALLDSVLRHDPVAFTQAQLPDRRPGPALPSQLAYRGDGSSPRTMPAEEDSTADHHNTAA